MISIPAVIRGHHATLLTAHSWPSKMITRSDSDSPGIESGERLLERSDTFHIRAVLSWAHEASRVRDRLNLIWLISSSWPLQKVNLAIKPVVCRTKAYTRVLIGASSFILWIWITLSAAQLAKVLSSSQSSSRQQSMTIYKSHRSNVWTDYLPVWLR